MATGQGGGGAPIRRRVIASGRVQGVFFRASLAQRAAELGVAGSARNRPDGSLEACFEGPPEAVERIVEYARHGPAGAAVETLEVSEEPPEGASGFTTV